jgi:hypothetical protein
MTKLIFKDKPQKEKPGLKIKLPEKDFIEFLTDNFGSIEDGFWNYEISVQNDVLDGLAHFMNVCEQNELLWLGVFLIALAQDKKKIRALKRELKQRGYFRHLNHKNKK